MFDPVSVAIIVIPAVLAVTVHEIAHGWMALKFGDDTAASRGRLSLNPLRHVDPLGTIVVPAVLWFGGEWLFGTRIFFGWAKPVPVMWQRLSPLRPAIAAVAAAGPLANLGMALAWFALGTLCARFGLVVLMYMCQAGVVFNLAIMIINLLPIPPLDGSRIVTAMLPPTWAARYNRHEMLGLMLVALLLLAGALDWLFKPLLRGLINWLTNVAT